MNFSASVGYVVKEQTVLSYSVFQCQYAIVYNVKCVHCSIYSVCIIMKIKYKCNDLTTVAHVQCFD